MTPISLKLEGFACYKDVQEFNFEGSSLWMLSGPNGSGKSSVFDAILYALYGVTRFGQQHIERMINQYADGLAIEFVIEANHREYKIIRSVSRKGTKSRSVYCEGQIVPNSTSDAGFDATIKQLLGFDGDAFQSAILLQQGQAERLLKALTPNNRGNNAATGIISQFISLTRYKQLATDADAKRKEVVEWEKRLKQELAALPNPTQEDIDTAKSKREKAQSEKEKVKEEVQCLTGLVPLAHNWETWTKEKEAIEKRLEELQTILTNAETICAEKAEYDRLTHLIPRREVYDAAKKALDDADKKIGEKTKALGTPLPQENAVQKELALCHKAGRFLPHLKTASDKTKENAKLNEEVGGEQETLPGLENAVQSAKLKAESANVALLTAQKQEQDATQNVALKKQTLHGKQEARQKLEATQGASTCSYCGQAITPEKWQELYEKAKREEQEAAEQLKTAQQDLTEAKKVRESADAASKAAQAESHTADAALTKAHNDIADQKKSIARNEEDIARAHEQIPADWPYDLEQTKAKDQEAGHWQRIATTLHELQNLLAKREGQQAAFNTAKESLPPNADIMTTLINLKDKFQNLKDAPHNYQLLQTAEKEESTLHGQLTGLETNLATVPVQARRPKAEVEKELKAAKTREKEAETALQTARDTYQRWIREQEERKHKEKESDEVAIQAALYKELATCLDEDHLQAWLLKRTEQAILDETNNVLDRLSQGRLRLELAEDSKNTSALLDLRCRDIETGQEPQYLDSLSGSQRFRVAVSLALGIGRFASVNAQRIQSLIIDEGFGSLDNDSLNEMGSALQDLAGDLNRIIVVSHQETFADRFPNRFKLRLTDNGTVVERVCAL